MARSSPRPRLRGASSCLWDHGAVQSGAVCASLSLGQRLGGKLLQKSVAEWLRRAGTGVRRGLVLSLCGSAAAKGRVTKKGSSHPRSPWATPAQGSPSLRPRLSVPRVPGSQETAIPWWPGPPAASHPLWQCHCTTRLVPRAGVIFDSLPLCQRPRRR